MLKLLSLMLSGIAIVIASFAGLSNPNTTNESLGTAPRVLTVWQGGTGANFFASTSLLYGNGTSTIGATSTPTVATIHATSTTASSTFKGIVAQTLNLSNSLSGAGLSSCSNGTNDKLLWNSLSNQFSCGIDQSGAGTLSIDWKKEDNYNALALTPTTTIAIWAKDAIYGSSTVRFDGNLAVGTSSVANGLNLHGNAIINGSILQAANITATGTITGFGLTASRLLQTDATKGLASVADLTSWVAGTANEITVVNDGDGSLTVSLPDAIVLQGVFASSTSAWGGLLTSYGGLMIRASSTINGAFTLSQLSNGILVNDNALGVSASSTPTVNAIFATSTTATSSFWGNIDLPTVGTSKIGIGTTTADLGLTIASTSAYCYTQRLGNIAQNITIDWKAGCSASGVLTAAAPAITFPDGFPGQNITLLLYQDATGGREPTFVGNIDFASSSANMFTDKAGNLDVITGKWDYGSSTAKWLLFLNAGNF